MYPAVRRATAQYTEMTIKTKDINKRRTSTETHRAHSRIFFNAFLCVLQSFLFVFSLPFPFHFNVFQYTHTNIQRNHIKSLRTKTWILSVYFFFICVQSVWRCACVCVCKFLVYGNGTLLKLHSSNGMK